MGGHDNRTPADAIGAQRGLSTRWTLLAGPAGGSAAWGLANLLTGLGAVGRHDTIPTTRPGALAVVEPAGGM